MKVIIAFLLLSVTGCSTTKEEHKENSLLHGDAPIVSFSLMDNKKDVLDSLQAVIKFNSPSPLYKVNCVYDKDSLGLYAVDFRPKYVGYYRPEILTFFITKKNKLIVNLKVLEEGAVNASYEFYKDNSDNKRVLLLNWEVGTSIEVIKSKINEIKEGYFLALDSISLSKYDKKYNLLNKELQLEIKKENPFIFSVKQLIIREVALGTAP
ncbi:MAG: hypothetical protein N4A35_10150 [Flavobacteriales bacterium]|jgi:hypothetical protein|nr:hypothetical protein [Flavobacteriales bacterium]